jgi:argininosuccinate lyase
LVEILPPLIKSTTINKERMAELSYGNFSTATELANYLVRSHNVSFRQSHHIVGSLVGELSRRGENFSNFAACIDHLKKNNIHAREEEVKQVLDPQQVMLSYKSLGGTGPEAVRSMLEKFKKACEAHRRHLEDDQRRVASAYEACRTIARQASSVKSAADLERLVQTSPPKGFVGSARSEGQH